MIYTISFFILFFYISYFNQQCDNSRCHTAKCKILNYIRNNIMSTIIPNNCNNHYQHGYATDQTV
ncbi:MAG: hypothetical protein KH383_01505 [Clostridium sp.]|nr:hypothetical protein [Clostridium sp.]RJX00597.1 hypothetical protein DWW43_05775 [Clostridium sp. AF15-41]